MLLRICSLTGGLWQCNYRVRMGENGEWYPLSRLSRNRVTTIEFIYYFELCFF